MLTKTESTALLRYLARGLKNNTISKAHGRQLMDLAGKIRLDNSKTKLADQAAYRIMKMLSFRPERVSRALRGGYLRKQINQILPVDQDTLETLVEPTLANALLWHNKDFNSQALYQAVRKKLNSYANNYAKLPTDGTAFSYAKATPLQDLLKNPANKVISKGTFNGQKVDPYRRGFAGKDASTFSDLFINKTSIGQGNYITAYPQIAGGYAGRHPDDIILEYDMSKLRDVNQLPLMWGQHQANNNRFQRIKERATGELFYGRNENWRNRPYYQTVAIMQPGFMPWNAIKNIYKPMTDAKGHKQYLKLDNWRDAFRPSKTLDMYTQLYS